MTTPASTRSRPLGLIGLLLMTPALLMGLATLAWVVATWSTDAFPASGVILLGLVLLGVVAFIAAISSGATCSKVLATVLGVLGGALAAWGGLCLCILGLIMIGAIPFLDTSASSSLWAWPVAILGAAACFAITLASTIAFTRPTTGPRAGPRQVSNLQPRPEVGRG